MPEQNADRKPLRAPLQGRSKDTLSRIVASARAVLENKGFDETTLGEIVAGAGVTVGAFYGRFPDKGALLDHLEQEAYDDFRAAVAADHFDSAPIADGTIEGAIRQFLVAMAQMYRTHKGVVRAIVLQSRSDATRQQRRMQFTGEMISGGVDRILTLRGTVRHPNPKRALKVALLFATAALRDVLLFDEDWIAESGEPMAEGALVEELTRAVTAYLELVPE